MILSILRSIGALVLSLVLAFALVVGVEIFGAIFHPFPPDVDPSDMEVCRRQVATCPQWILAVSAVAWGAIVFIAAWVATRLGAHRHIAHGIVIGGFLCLAAGFNISMLPYPIWFNIANLILLPTATFWGARLASRPPPARS